MFRTYAARSSSPQRPQRAHNSGSRTMKVASEHLPHARDLSGPAAAILVALAGAGLVALGLLLVGTRDVSRLGFTAPGTPFATLETAG